MKTFMFKVLSLFVLFLLSAHGYQLVKESNVTIYYQEYYELTYRIAGWNENAAQSGPALTLESVEIARVGPV